MVVVVGRARGRLEKVVLATADVVVVVVCRGKIGLEEEVLAKAEVVAGRDVDRNALQ